jgi:GNAT superfamily N-acetyltransferase
MPASTAPLMMNPVRLAQPGDLSDLVALCSDHARFERASHEVDGKEAALQTALFGDRPRLTAWVAIVQGKTVGFATATEDFSTWAAAPFLHMDCLFVREAHRGGGLGAALLHAVAGYARDRGLGELQWQTPAWNLDAGRFYQRHGAIAAPKLRFRLPIGRPA